MAIKHDLQLCCTLISGEQKEALSRLGFCGAVDGSVSSDSSCLLHTLKTKELQLYQSLKIQTFAWAGPNTEVGSVHPVRCGGIPRGRRDAARLRQGGDCPRTLARCVCWFPLP